MNLNEKELEAYIELSNFRHDFPQLMQQENWDLLNELREKRFEGE